MKSGWIFVVLAAVAVLSGCSKNVGKNSVRFAVTEPTDPLPSPSVSPSASPSPLPSLSPSPSPSPTGPAGDCRKDPLQRFEEDTVFSRGRIILEEVQSEGRVVALHDGVLHRTAVGMKLPPEGTRADLVVGRRLTIGDSQVPHGQVIAGGRLRKWALDAPFGAGPGNVDHLPREEAEVLALQEQIFSLPVSGTTELICPRGGKNCELFLRGSQKTTNVVDVTPAEIRAAVRVRFEMPGGSTAIVRVKGKKRVPLLKFRFEEIDLGTLESDHVIWSTSGIVKVIAHQKTLPGTWMVPGTQILANESWFHGSVFSSCVTSRKTRFLLTPFKGCLPP